MAVDSADRKEIILKIYDRSNDGSIPAAAAASATESGGGKIWRESSYDFWNDSQKIESKWKKENVNTNGTGSSGSNSNRESEGFDFMQSKQEAMEDPPSKLIGQFLHKQKASGEFSLDMDLEMDELQQVPPHYHGSLLPTVAESPSPSAAALPRVSFENNPVRRRQSKGSPSPGKEESKESRETDGVVKCSSNSSFKRSEGGSFQRKSSLLGNPHFIDFSYSLQLSLPLNYRPTFPFISQTLLKAEKVKTILMQVEIQSTNHGGGLEQRTPAAMDQDGLAKSLDKPSQHIPITTNNPRTPKGLTLIPLIFLIYFEVAGGPFGEEPAVQAAGPLLALLGFLLFPFIWSVPEALITAELSTAFPGNGGFIIWAERAFGPFFGSLMGSWKFLSGVINIAAFPVLCVDYLEKIIHPLESGWRRHISILISTLLLSFINYTGLTIVGWAAVFLGVVSLLPFIVMSLIAIPKIQPHRWLSLGQKGVKRDWNLFFNTLFWNLNFWDNVSTLAGEVDKPQKTFPRALLVAVIFTCVAYLVPLFAVIGAVSVDQSDWEAGFHAEAAEMIAGRWLKFWIEVGAVLSAIGLFEAQLSSCAYQLEGMANLAILPKFFDSRSKWFNTPWVGILLSTLITIGMSYMDYTDIISSANFLYSLGMLLEFASFIWLRRKLPEIKRPYKVPLKIPGLVVICLIPSAFLVVIMVIATKIVYLVSGLMTVGAIGWYFLMNFCRRKKIFKFSLVEGE